MGKKKLPEPDDKEQSERFIETAKRAEAEDEVAFEEAIENIVSQSKKTER
jgi:hypothetical protein